MKQATLSNLMPSRRWSSYAVQWVTGHTDLVRHEGGALNPCANQFVAMPP